MVDRVIACNETPPLSINGRVSNVWLIPLSKFRVLPFRIRSSRWCSIVSGGSDYIASSSPAVVEEVPPAGHGLRGMKAAKIYAAESGYSESCSFDTEAECEAEMQSHLHHWYQTCCTSTRSRSTPNICK